MESSPVSFTRRVRLTRPAEYRRVFAQSGRASSSVFTVLAASNGLSYPRLGLAIAKKAVAKAVARNRIKRIVRESFRLRQCDIGGWDIVLMAKPSAAKSSKQLLRAELEEHWNRLIRRQCVPSSL